MQLNDRITIQKNTDNLVDEEGLVWKVGEIIINVGLVFRTVGWKEYFSAMAVQAQNTVTFTIRYSTKIKVMLEDPIVTKNYRVVYKKKEYDIKYINDIENKHEYVDIKAECIM